MKLWENIALVFAVVMATGAAVFAVTTAILSEPAVGQNLCGNSCISSADCMEGCVCMDDEGDGLGVCVGFN